MKIFLEMNPPTATAQEKSVRVFGGKPIFFDPAPVKRAKKLLTDCLILHRPEHPMQGALSLSTTWLFPKGKSHKAGEWRVTRPDTDNLQKLLKDCMTRCGFWKDDAQVVREIIEKKWADEPCGIRIEIARLEAEDGRKQRNAEGYRDPTASLAIGRCARLERRARLKQSQRIGYPKKRTKKKGADSK